MSLEDCCRCCGCCPAEGRVLHVCCEPPYGHYSCRQMLSECFNLSFSSEARIGGVCDRCVSRLTDSWEFRQQVVRTENFLLQQAGGHTWEEATHSPTAVSGHIPFLSEQETVLQTKTKSTESESADRHRTWSRSPAIVAEAVKSDDDHHCYSPADESCSDSESSNRTRPSVNQSDTVLLTEQPVKAIRSKKKCLFEENISKQAAKRKTHSNKIIIAKRSREKNNLNYDIFSQRMKRLDEVIDRSVKTNESDVKTAAKIGTTSKRKTKIFTPASFKRIKVKPKTYNCQPIRTSIDAPSTPTVLDGDPKHASAANAAIIVQLSNVCPFKVKNHEYFCFYCDRPFSEPTKLREHTASDHKPGAMRRNPPQFLKKVDVTDVSCRLCTEEIRDLASLKEHLEEKHEKKFYAGNSDGILPFKLSKDSFECAICEKTFQLFNAANQHMNEHFANFVCETCGLGFAEEPRLNAHKSKHESRKFACERCGKEFQSRQARKAHEDRVHDGRGHIKCCHCAETFASYEKRRSHLESAHGKARRTFSCARCDKLFASKRLVTSHTQKEHIHVC